MKRILRKVQNWLWRLHTWREGNRWTIGIFGAIFDDKGRIILVRQRGRDKWGLPGGGVGSKDCLSGDGQATFLQALFRELKEELDIDTRQLLEIEQGRNFFSPKLKDLAILYWIRIEGGSSIRAMSEIAEFRFIAKEELRTRAFPILGPRMAKMIEWAFLQISID